MELIAQEQTPLSSRLAVQGSGSRLGHCCQPFLPSTLPPARKPQRAMAPSQRAKAAKKGRRQPLLHFRLPGTSEQQGPRLRLAPTQLPDSSELGETKEATLGRVPHALHCPLPSLSGDPTAVSRRIWEHDAERTGDAAPEGSLMTPAPPGPAQGLPLPAVM